MTEEMLKDAAPTLTFEPFAEEKAETLAVQEPAPAVEAPVFDESSLTPEEKKMVDDFSAQIDLANTNLVLQFGSGAQKKIADFSETALANVRTKDLGEVGDVLSSVVTQLKSFDVDEEEKGFFGFFKKNANKVTALRAKYEKAEGNINQISTRSSCSRTSRCWTRCMR